MSWFRTPKAKPDYTGLQLQTATSTLPIPLIWGQNKVAANVVWYQNFQTSGGRHGKGGLFGGGASAYSYSADLVMALCEGPVTGLGTIWRDQSSYTLADLGLTFFNGATPQSVWGYLASAYPAQALAYQGTCYVAAASYQLGDSANIGNHNFEIVGPLAGTGVNGIDADPAQVICDFLTNPRYGAGFASGSINATSLFGSSGDASLQTYCKALGLAFSPCLVSTEAASSVLTRWLQILNCAAVWSGGELKFIPYGDAPIAAGNVTRTLQSAVPTPVAASTGATPSPSIVVCAASAFVTDGGVSYAFNGTALTYVGASAPSSAGHYGISPAGTYLFSAADVSQVVSITFTYAIAASYVPNMAPVYSLTDADFVDEKTNKDPVQASRLDPFSLPTIQRIEVLSRDSEYGAVPVEARDQSQIELYGPRVGSTIQAHEICDALVMGPIVAQLILQRGLYVRTHFTFKLSWEYGLLDPMDIVEITDANLGLNAYPVRINAIEEDDRGLLTVTAEELTTGVSTPVLYPNNGSSGLQPNQGVAADAVNTPLIYEPPPLVTGNVAQVWVGASGGTAGAADPNWGGAYVWASVDDVTYSQIGTVTQPMRQGFLSSPLGSAAGWDTSNTLSVNLTESGGVLTGTSAASAQAGATLSLVDGELLAYESATLTGANAYALTGLQRGFGGTTAAAHSSGAPFARLDATIVKFDLPDAWIGVALHFKFQSFNVFGAGVQPLSACTAYTYTPQGSGALGAVTQALQIGTALDYGFASQGANEGEDWGDVTSAPVTFIDLGNVTS